MRDSFSATIVVPYSRDALWLGMEVWRSIIGERFKAAGGQGKQTQITMYWDGGGHSTRRMAQELRDFARQEHLEPSAMESTVYNADILEATMSVVVRATFWTQPEIEMRINGNVRQDVVGLEALLRQEIEVEMQDARERDHDRAIRIHEKFLADRAERQRLTAPAPAPSPAPLSSADTTPQAAPGSQSRVVRNWVLGSVSTVALGLLIAYLSHAFGWNA